MNEWMNLPATKTKIKTKKWKILQIQTMNCICLLTKTLLQDSDHELHLPATQKNSSNSDHEWIWLLENLSSNSGHEWFWC
jgi:hypothetical protein